MRIGTIKEIMDNEFRVGLNASSVSELVELGHEVYIETNAGLESGYSDKDYKNAGATILKNASEVWEISDLIVKVKEPLKSEYQYFREGLMIFSYLHLSAQKPLVEALIKSKTTAIAFETIETKTGELPALKPMSQIAGRMAAIIGAEFLQKAKGGSGVLISGLPGVRKANAVIVGAGNVGQNALEILVGLGANVTILDVDISRLSELEFVYGNKIETLYSNSENLERMISKADLVVGAVSLPGAKTPQLIKRKYYKNMIPGSVIVDVAIDQGGSTEVSRKTSHEDPVFFVDNVMHYCVPNIPGAVPLTATNALNNAIINYVKMIANKGLKKACESSLELNKGVNILEGKIVYKAIADALNLKFN